MSTLENITKAAQSADLLVGDLIAANRTADPVVHLHLMAMLDAASALRNQLNRLAGAMAAQ